MNLSVALILTIIVFLAGIRAKDLKGCQAVAVLIHYFVLASFMWMAVEGFNLYLSFVKVMNTGISRFMLKSSIFAWGMFLPSFSILPTPFLVILLALKIITNIIFSINISHRFDPSLYFYKAYHSC